jgi:hypothetical protein
MPGKMADNTLQKYIDGLLTPMEKAMVLAPRHDEVSELLLSCHPTDYSASAIARAVEDCDAQLLGLSVTSMRDDNGYPVIALRVNLRDASGVDRSLRRYGFNTIFVGTAHDSARTTRARERANELLHYLEI